MPKKKVKREKLLDAGISLLASKSPSEISMDDIAAEVGVTKPMVYYYFGSKTGFYEHLVDYIISFLQEMLNTCMKSASSFREVLKELIASRIIQQSNYPELSNAVRILATTKVICGAESRSKMLALFSSLEPLFNQAKELGEIRADADLRLVMALLNSLMEGALRIHGKEFFKTVNPADFAEKLIRLLFDGIGTGKRSD